MRKGLMLYARIVPDWNPANTVATARLLFAGDTQLDSSRCTVGIATLSETPTNARAPSRKTMFACDAASGVTIVPTLHNSIPTVMTHRGDSEAMSKPLGKIPIPYPTENSDDIDPFMLSV